jgi:hypothetical protein
MAILAYYLRILKHNAPAFCITTDIENVLEP